MTVQGAWRRADRGDIVLMVCTIGLGVLVSMRWWDLPRWPIPVVQAGFPILGIGALLWLGILLLARRWRVAAVAAVVALAPVGTAIATLGSDTVPARASDEIVLTANLEFGAGDAEAVVERVRALGATTLVLTEVTPQAQERLRRAGLPKLLPQEVGSPRPAAAGTIIRSRHRLTAVEESSTPGSFDQPVARVHRPGGATYLLRGVHTYPPQRGLSQAWRGHLRDLEHWARAQPSTEPVVLAGDFNGSHAHPGFRDLIGTFTDAQRAAGDKWVRTWPRGSAIPPFIALDHVLVRNASVVDAGTSIVPNTDHAAVWARLRIR